MMNSMLKNAEMYFCGTTGVITSFVVVYKNTHDSHRIILNACTLIYFPWPQPTTVHLTMLVIRCFVNNYVYAKKQFYW